MLYVNSQMWYSRRWRARSWVDGLGDGAGKGKVGKGVGEKEVRQKVVMSSPQDQLV